MNFNTFGGFQKDEYFFFFFFFFGGGGGGGWRWVYNVTGYVGGHGKNVLFLGVIYKHSRVFLKVKIQNWNIGGGG